MNWALSALCFSFLTLVLTFSASGQALYGLSNGSSFEPETNQIYRIDPATGDTFNAHVVTLGGVPVDRSNALAARPSDGTLFAVVQVGPNGPTARRLVTIDPSTGIATQIGVVSQAISGLAFRPDGTLWAVSGDGATISETLWTVNTSDATLTQQFALGNGDDGEAIAFHPTNGLLYHSSGFDPAIFESVDVDSEIVTPIGAPTAEEAFGLSYSRILGQMYLSDFVGDLYTVDLATGARTFVGPIDSPIDPVDLVKVANRGLAFVENTTSAPATITGRLVTRSGEPVHKATVTATGLNGAVYTATSNKRGQFSLVGLPTGETYTIGAEAKRYRFNSTVITLNQDLAGFTLTATR